MKGAVVHYYMLKTSWVWIQLDFADSDYLSIGKWFLVFILLVFLKDMKCNFEEQRKMRIIENDFLLWIWLIFGFNYCSYDQITAFILTKIGVTALVGNCISFCRWDWGLFYYFWRMRLNVEFDWICLIELA